MNGNKVCARFECAFDLNFFQSAADRRKYVAATEHVGAQLAQLQNGTFSITYELKKVASNQCLARARVSINYKAEVCCQFPGGG